MESASPKPTVVFLNRLIFVRNPPKVGNWLSDYIITPLLATAAVIINTLLYTILKLIEIVLHIAGQPFYSEKVQNDGRYHFVQDPVTKDFVSLSSKVVRYNIYKDAVSHALGFYSDKPELDFVKIAETVRQYTGSNKWKYWFKLYPTNNRWEYKLNSFVTMPLFMILVWIVSYPINLIANANKKPVWVRPEWAKRLTNLTDEEIRRIDLDVEREYLINAQKRFIEEAPLREEAERKNRERAEFWEELSKAWDDPHKPGIWEINVYNKFGSRIGFKNVFSGRVRKKPYY